jgi:sulfoxide reductase heme-binding subunit YedZ
MLSLLPDAAAFLLREPDSAADLSRQANEALGTMALLTLAGTLAVGPLGTVTGWRWHLILGRDLGLWTFVLAMVDLIIAMITAPGDWLGGVAGTAFVAAGAAAALVMVPLAVTSNRYSMQMLGRFWKLLHRLVYAVLALVVVHLVLLAGAQALIPIVVLFGPSLVLRVPAVRSAVVKWRKGRQAVKC